MGGSVTRFDGLSDRSMRYTSYTTVSVGKRSEGVQGGCSLGKIQQLVGRRTRISPVIPFPAPSSGMNGIPNSVSKLSLVSTKNRFNSSSSPKLPSPSEKPIVTCVNSSPDVPCGKTVLEIFKNSISGSSERLGACEHEMKKMAMKKTKKVENREAFVKAIQSDSLEKDFESLSIKLFEFQFWNNPIYQKYVNLLNVELDQVTCIQEIPFLPISFFKSHRVQTGVHPGDPMIFRSSGTTGQSPAQHIVPDVDLYTKNAVRGFTSAFSDPLKDMYFLGLLPSYLERNDASLVYMAQEFADQSKPLPKHFFLNDFEALSVTLNRLLSDETPVVLLGVTFALLDFARQYPGDYKGLTVIETGGMKGHGPELVRPALHRELKENLRGVNISSEYGMTELMSQAYWKDGYFEAAPTMRVFPREITDPLAVAAWEQSAALNIVDLANIDSCSFIASSDLGRVQPGGKKFEVLGRMDHAEIRGCNLMYAPD